MSNSNEASHVQARIDGGPDTITQRSTRESVRGSLSAEDSVRYVNAVITGLEAMCSNKKESNCLTVDVVESLCQSRETCRAFVGQTNYFSDATHISPSASRLTSDQYTKAIRAILKSE